MRGRHDTAGCFPTGRHYPGIAERIAQAIDRVEGLCEAFDAAAPWRTLPFAVLDFETTGRDPQLDRVVEIGIVCFSDGVRTERYEQLINPGREIPEEAKNVHGISNEDVRGAPRFGDVVGRVFELLQGHLPVAYNAAFDRGFLLAECQRNRDTSRDTEPPPALIEDVVWIDPLVWAREILKGQRSRKLAAVAKYFGVDLSQAHRAAGDAQATGEVLLAMADQMPSSYGELIRLQRSYAARQEHAMSFWRRG
ncbi:MAG: 3'-5' exonuclease [Myxococcota bacterium]